MQKKMRREWLQSEWSRPKRKRPGAFAAEQEYGKTLEEQSLQEAGKMIAELKETASQKESEAVRMLISEVI